MEEIAQASVAAEVQLAQSPRRGCFSSDGNVAWLLAVPQQMQAYSLLLVVPERLRLCWLLPATLEQTLVCSFLAAAGKSFRAPAALVAKLVLGKRYSPVAPVVTAWLPGWLQRKAVESLPRPTGRPQKFSRGVP